MMKAAILRYMQFPIWALFLLSMLPFPSSAADGTATPPPKGADVAAVSKKGGDTADGIAALRASLQENPDAAIALRLGNLLLGKGAADEALKAFEEALNINPRSHEAKIGMGVALGRLGEYDKAELTLRDALRLNPDPGRVHYHLGLLYESRGDFANALSEFKEGLKNYSEGMN